MTEPTTVGEYIAALPGPQREIGERLRAVIDAALPDATSALFHGHPVWGRGAKPGADPVCLLKAYPHHVTFGLWQGQRITDGSGRLAAAARSMAVVKLRGIGDIDAGLFTDWLGQAAVL